MGSKELEPTDSVNKSTTLKYEPRCSICNSSEETLSLINTLLIQGTGATQIVRQVGPIFRALGLNKLTHAMVSTHRDRHFSVKNEAVRKVYERKIRKQLELGEDAAEVIADAVLATEVIMNKGLQEVLEEDSRVGVANTLAAAKMLNEFRKEDDGQAQLIAANKEFSQILRATKAVVTPEQFARIIAIMDEQEVLEVQSSFDDEEDDYGDEPVSVGGVD